MNRTAYQILVKVDLQDRRHGVDNVDQFKILKQRRIACTFGRVFGLVICHLLNRPANVFELAASSTAGDVTENVDPLVTGRHDMTARDRAQ
jgi:hypothetical protein